ncbi:MAG TPA: urease accessory protein UreD [Streptosporangiaceae bacterium]
MKAVAELVAAAGPDGSLRLPVQRSQAPLILRRTADAVYLVSGAAGPLGGDTLELRIEVQAGAALRLRTVAAAVALPGRYGEESRFTVTATVGPGARLEYLPKPTVAADGARHRTEVTVRLAADATLLLRDEVLLGRHGERGGACRTRLAVDRDGARGGRPLLRHELNVSGTDGASLGPAVLAGHRAAGMVLAVEPDATDGSAVAHEVEVAGGIGVTGVAGMSDVARVAGVAGVAGVAKVAGGTFGAGGAIEPWVAMMPLAGPGVLVTALAHDTQVLRQRLDWGLDQLPGRPPSAETGVAPVATAVLSGTGGGIA